MIRVFVVDDQELVRAGIVATVRAQDDMEVIGEAADGEQAVRGILRTHPDVVLMDLQMPIVDGVEAIRRLRAAEADAALIALTTFDTDDNVFRALHAGASGFLVKDASVDDVVAAIRSAVGGDAVLSPTVASHVVAQFLAFAPDPVRRAAEREALAPREIEIVGMIAEGLSNAEIAGRLHLSEATVKTHVGRVLTKIGLRDRVQIAVWALGGRKP
ncbi:response regulator [Microbacterium sp. M]|uniref:response regulator n=1 Tax=Microbacterium sp. M TaxID=3377125 RepID=UPI0038709CFC